MKKIVFLYIIIAVALFFASCSDDDSTTSSTAKYVTINLQIGTDSTLNISGSSTPFTYNNSAQKLVRGKTLTATRSSGIPDFVPVVKTNFTAYLIANENKNGFSTNQFVDSVPVHTGSNYITVRAMKYKVFVSNYKKDGQETNIWLGENWYGNNSGIGNLPPGSTTLYLFGDTTIVTNEEDGKILTGEIKMRNPYAAVCVYKNDYVSDNPSNWRGTCDLDSIDSWYYLYYRCYNGNGTENINTPVELNVPIKYTNTNGNSINENRYIDGTISANNIYYYIIDY